MESEPAHFGNTYSSSLNFLILILQEIKRTLQSLPDVCPSSASQRTEALLCVVHALHVFGFSTPNRLLSCLAAAAVHVVLVQRRARWRWRTSAAHVAAGCSSLSMRQAARTRKCARTIQQRRQEK